MKTVTQNTVIVKKISRSVTREDYSVQEHSRLTLVYIITGDTDMEVSPAVHLAGRGASATIIGLITGSKHGKIRMHTLQHHKAPDTTSNLLVKSVLSDASEIFYDGSILVDLCAQKTDAYQRNENLLRHYCAGWLHRKNNNSSNRRRGFWRCYVCSRYL